MHDELVRDGRRITVDSPPDHLHELRKDAKRLRYVVDAYGSLVRGRHRRDHLRRIKALLDHLGAHQDAVVRLHELQALALELADAPPATCTALADLIDDAAEEAERRRDEFAEVFARFDRRRTRRALDRVLEDLRA